MICIIRRSFGHLNANMFKLLYKAMTRPHIEDAAVTRNEIIELPRAAKIDLPTLRFRRLRGDVIEVYKMLSVVNIVKNTS